MGMNWCIGSGVVNSSVAVSTQWGADNEADVISERHWHTAVQEEHLHPVANAIQCKMSPSISLCLKSLGCRAPQDINGY